MLTKRAAIDTLRQMLKEKNADSNYTNQFLYNILQTHARWLIKREISSGRIYKNNSLFQTLGCQEVIESSTIDNCCPVKTDCKIYRSKKRLPEMWIDNDGPVIKTITSVDGTTEFFVTSAKSWQNKRKDPYQRMQDLKYAFFADGYLWFPEHDPKRININGFYTDDIADKNECDGEAKPCIRYLDTAFGVPDWVESEMFSKALQQIFPTLQIQEQNQVDKNPTRKN